MKAKEYFFISLLLAICIAGHFYHYLGFAAMAIAFYILLVSIKKKRNGCKTACPRSVFLQKSMKKISKKHKLPHIFRKKWFEYLILLLFLAMLSLRVSNAPDIQSFGYVFVFMCTVSTTVALVMGYFSKPKSWCTICPVGTSQDIIWEKFSKMKKQ